MNILFKTVFGSHLYGTDTPTSDQDFKGVFKSSYEDCILRKDKSTIVQSVKNSSGERNAVGDVDIEYKELRSFIDDCAKGQTYALDMLFAPKEHWLENSPEWEFLIKNRDKLLSKNVKPYIGYCRQQAGKYGLKGSRLGELMRVIKHFQGYSKTELIRENLAGLDFGEFVFLEKLPVSPKNQPVILGEFLNVLGRKFELNSRVENMMQSLDHMNAKYGERAVKAMNNEGIDWKAISHAFRCCFQLQELATTGEIKFPLKESKFLKQVKSGTLNFTDLQGQLSDQLEIAIKAVEDSKLPENADPEFFNPWILELYKN